MSEFWIAQLMPRPASRAESRIARGVKDALCRGSRACCRGTISTATLATSDGSRVSGFMVLCHRVFCQMKEPRSVAIEYLVFVVGRDPGGQHTPQLISRIHQRGIAAMHDSIRPDLVDQ